LSFKPGGNAHAVPHPAPRYIDGAGWTTLVALLASDATWSLFLR
jgi:hypothetical protein